MRACTEEEAQYAPQEEHEADEEKAEGMGGLPMNAEAPTHQANGAGAGIGEQKGGKLRAVREEKGSGSDKTVFARAVLPVGQTKGVMFQACAALSAAKLHMA